MPNSGEKRNLKTTSLIYGGKLIKNKRLKNTFVRITEETTSIYKSK